MEEKKLKRILEYVWIAVVLLVGYYFLKEKSIWVLFLMTFLLAGLGTLFINFFFDSLNAWKKKKKEQVKEGIYAKVEAHISGDYFLSACRYWNY